MAREGPVKRGSEIFIAIPPILDHSLPMRLEQAWTAAESAAFDRHAQQQLGLAEALLMENAGQAAAREARALLEEAARGPEGPSGRDAPILVLAGPGNNGGDALVTARALHGATSHPVRIWAPLGLRPPDEDGAAAAAHRAVRALELPVDLDAAPPKALRVPGSAPALIVDGLFGVGLGRPLDGDAARAVNACTRNDAPVLALDVPSGLDADSGEILGACLPARRTVSFIGIKRGLLCGQGPQVAGTLVRAGIGLSDDYAETWRDALKRGS